MSLRWILGNPVDVGQFLAHPLVEGGSEVVVPELVEARDAVGQGARLQQRIHTFRAGCAEA